MTAAPPFAGEHGPGVAHAPSPPPRISGALLESVAHLRSNLDRVFEYIAVELPRLAEDVSKIVSTLQSSSLRQSAGSVSGLKGARAALAQELRAARTWILDSQHGIDRTLAELRPGVEQLRGALTEVRNGALQLRILALNASLVARRSGERMLGFAASTTELTQIAAEQLRESVQVMGIVDAVTTHFRELEELGQSLLQKAESITTTRTDDSLNGVLSAYTVIETRLHDVAERCQAIGVSIGRTMIAIQRQDILRQGLDHVELIARELLACEDVVMRSKDDLLTAELLQAVEVQRRGGRLCADLLMEIERETQELLNEVESHLVRLGEMATFVNQVTGDAMSSDLHGRVRALRSSALEVEHLLTMSSQARDDEARLLSALSETVQRLPARLRMFVERQEQVRTLGTLIRRQNARGLAESESRAIGESLNGILNDAFADWSNLDEIGEFRVRIRGLVRSSSVHTDASNGRITQRLGEIEVAAAGISQHAQSMMRVARSAVGNMGNVSHRVVGEIASLQAELTTHARVVEDFHAISEQATNLTRRLGGVDGMDVELPDRLGRLIERFTIFSHKRIAWNEDGGEPTGGEEGGSVTLF